MAGELLCKEYPQADLVVRPAELEDAVDLAPRLTDLDVLEAQASGYSDGLAALRAGICQSPGTVKAAYALVAKHGPVVGVFGGGTLPDDDTHAYIWLMTAKRLSLKHKRALLRYGWDWIEHLATYLERPKLLNYVDTRQKLHIAWIQAMGFNIDTSPIHRLKGVTFYRFHKVIHV